MTAKVKCKSKRFESKQTVLLSGISELFESKVDKIFLLEPAKRDPDKTKLQLRLKFSGDSDGWLSVYLLNNSNRKVYFEEYTFSLYQKVKFGSGKLAKTRIRDLFIQAGKGWGWAEFYSLEKWKKAIGSGSTFGDFKLKCRVVYGGKVKDDGVKLPSGDKHDNLCSLAADLQRILSNEESGDVTFKIGQSTIKAHKTLLTARSVYFEKMFSTGMTESISGMVEIKECDPEMFRIMLNYIYTDEVPRKLNEIAKSLIPVADMFLVPGLKQACIRSLEPSLSPKNLKEHLILAHKFNCQDLKALCIKTMVNDMRESERWDLIHSVGDSFDGDFFKEMATFLSEKRN